MHLQPSILARRGGWLTRRSSVVRECQRCMRRTPGAAPCDAPDPMPNAQETAREVLPHKKPMLTTSKPEGNKPGRTSQCFSQSCSHVPEHVENYGHQCIARMLTKHLMETTACGHGWAWDTLAPETAYATKKHTFGLRYLTAEDQTWEAPRGKRLPNKSAQTWRSEELRWAAQTEPATAAARRA